MNNIFPILFALLLGLVLGSFYACYIYRSIAEKPAIGKRSSCPACGTTLRIRELIPIFSYLFLRGRCGHCSTAISPLYITIESVSALLSLALMLRLGPSAVFVVYLLAFGVMLVGSVIDYYTFTLPDACTLGALCTLIPLGIFLEVFTLRYSLYGAVFAGGTAAFLYLYFRYVRRTIALGLGDVKYLFFLGALLGLQDVPLMYFLSASLGIIYVLSVRIRYGKDYSVWETAIPFGPFLSIAAAALMFWRG